MSNISDAMTDGERLDGLLAAIAELELLIAERDKRDGFNAFPELLWPNACYGLEWFRIEADSCIGSPVDINQVDGDRISYVLHSA